jgi:hypothetical protein
MTFLPRVNFLHLGLTFFNWVGISCMGMDIKFPTSLNVN